MGLRTRIIASTLIALAACGPVPTDGGTERSSGLVYVRASSGLAAYDPTSGATRIELGDGIPARDLSFIATSEERDGVTTLTRRSPGGGVLGRTELAGDFVANVVSGSGDLVALTPPRSPGATPWLPDGRARTEIAIADREGQTRRFSLEGNFEPEAFATDESELFLIEYIPATAPERYRVRRLKLDNGRVRPIGRLKLAAPGQMQGTGRTQVMSPSGHELYTLYTQQNDPGHEGAHAKGESHAFVHQLNLDDSWAHCIDLPMPFGHGDATAGALAISPDGSRLYVSDWTNGAVALVRPDKVKMQRSERIELGEPDVATFAAAATDRVYLAGNAAIVVLQASSLRLLDRWQLPDEVQGLALEPGEDRLIVSLRDAILTLNARSGEEVGRVPVPEGGPIVHVTQASKRS